MRPSADMEDFNTKFPAALPAITAKMVACMEDAYTWSFIKKDMSIQASCQHLLAVAGCPPAVLLGRTRGRREGMGTSLIGGFKGRPPPHCRLQDQRHDGVISAPFAHSVGYAASAVHSLYLSINVSMVSCTF